LGEKDVFMQGQDGLCVLTDGEDYHSRLIPINCARLSVE
jgi:hypothetical protein